MKKLFAFSVLSMLAVMGVAQAELAGKGFVTAGRIASEIASAVADKVDKVQIVTSAEGQAMSVAGQEVPVSVYSSAVQGGFVDVQESMDSEVASVNTVAEHFVPNMAMEYRDDYHGDVSFEMQPGLYTIMVQVDESGNKTFIWQAVQQSRYTSSVGGGN